MPMVGRRTLAAWGLAAAVVFWGPAGAWAAGDQPPPVSGGLQKECSFGIAAAWVFPFVYGEARWHVTPTISLTGSVAGLVAEGVLVGHLGAEVRNHFLRESWFDPHLGAIGGLLAFVSTEGIAGIAWVGGLSGFTFRLTPAVRLDLQAMFPVGLLYPETGFGLLGERVPLIPVLRLRWVEGAGS